MRRRDFIILLAGAMGGWPFALRAQQKAMPVIGFLHGSSPAQIAPLVAALRESLSETGYIEGQNIAIEYRWAEGHYDRLPALAADLVAHKVAVIVAIGSSAARSAKSATPVIPIVFLTGDPVADGLVANLARPGGNLTGVTNITEQLLPKRLELLSELVPQAGVIAQLGNPSSGTVERNMQSMQEAARMKGLRLTLLRASTASEIDAAFASLAELQASAIVVSPDPFFFGRLEQLVALAARYAVPAIYPWREFAASGGLISYAASITSTFRNIGTYVGKILKGVTPGDLPVQQPTEFELVINLKTAKTLGLTVPPSILARADEVIE